MDRFEDGDRGLGRVDMRKSAGRSTKPVPGRPYHAVRYAWLIVEGIASGRCGRMATLTCGVSIDTASSSWKEPLPTVYDSQEPARRSMGKQLAEELMTYASISV